jgi:hypothetical protein
MAKNFWKTSSTKEILLTLAKVGCFVVAASSPYFLHNVIRTYLKVRSRKAAYYKARKLRELKMRKLISFKELADSLARIELTQNGKQIVYQYKLDEMKLRRPAKWDGAWRLVIYDIPNFNKKARDVFRLRLKFLGLYSLQKSVWISPYDCWNEIEFLCTVFNININRCLIYLKLNNLPEELENKLKNFFDL